MPHWLPQGPTEQGVPMQVHAFTVSVKVPQDRTDLALQELPNIFSIINLLLESPESHSLLVH